MNKWAKKEVLSFQTFINRAKRHWHISKIEAHDLALLEKAYEDGVVSRLNSSRKMELHLNTKYSDEITSNTLPELNVRNVKLAGKKHPKTGIAFDLKGFPIFDDVAKFDTILPSSVSKIKKHLLHAKEATKKLKDAINSGQVSSSIFSEKQLRAINNLEDRVPGFTWHHHQDRGRMQLVPASIHRLTGHIGGWAVWFR